MRRLIPVGFAEQILPVLSPRLASLVMQAVPRLPAPLEEIRVREGRPLAVVLDGHDLFVTADGLLTTEESCAYRCTHDDLVRSFQLVAQGSVYAWEEEVRNGFVTLSGGHRVGIAGRAVTEAGQIRTVKQVASLNIRIAREVLNCAAPLLARMLRGGRLLSTLLISPPGAGKTTMLRDLIRQISRGVPLLGLKGQKVGLVDERSELAGCSAGVPQRDVGPRTDVLDGCPKAEGIMLLIRSMSPMVIAVDEIGRKADAEAIMEALYAGVTVLATAHGAGLEDVKHRPALAELLRARAFARAAILSRSRGPGTLERLVDLTEADRMTEAIRTAEGIRTTEGGGRAIG